MKNKYSFRKYADRDIFHLFEVSLFENENGDELVYDLTYSSMSDSVIMNFTYTLKSPHQIDSIKYKTARSIITANAKKLFIEPKAKSWHHRYSVEIPSAPLFELYVADADPSIELYAQGECYLYSVKKSAWQKYSPIGMKIFEIIKLQK